MRHQNRHGHLPENLSGRPTEHQFTQSRLAVGTHHEQIGPVVGDHRKEHVAGVDVACGERLRLGTDAVARQVQADVGARQLG